MAFKDKSRCDEAMPPALRSVRAYHEASGCSFSRCPCCKAKACCPKEIRGRNVSRGEKSLLLEPFCHPRDERKGEAEPQGQFEDQQRGYETKHTGKSGG